MTESGKDHSNFTVIIIIAFFQETVKHQSLRNCGGYLLFLCYFMAYDSRKVRHTFLFQRTGILVHALYRMADIVLRCLRVDRADPQNGPAFQLGGQHAGKALKTLAF